ncbi:MAG TPA: S-layer protein [Planctomycetaceae bacterium]|nr:S-layer protein [Planctomycetaceae bacterium]HRF02386.1 DUF1553 domain-containing protein [Pirellulaceae bacterium]
MKRCRFVPASAVMSCLLLLAATVSAQQPEPPGLGDPGNPIALTLEAVGDSSGILHLAGKDAGGQLVATTRFDSGQERDRTREASYASEPAGIVSIDSTGYVRPIAEGTAVITASADGHAASITVAVSGIINDPPVNFPNQIVPIFTKHGCNGGGCHGKSGGQNGFRLSLLGFEPTEDFEYLVKEGRGRRIFPAAPDMSLLLTKATGEVPHGGGARIEKDSPSYAVLRRWIAQGMPYGSADAPTVVGIEVHPRDRVLGRDAQQQLFVLARYSDGSTEDVTRMTTFESNDGEMASVDVRGLVTTAKLTGSVAIMCRYQGHVDVFRATVPLGLQVDDLPTERTLVDTHVFAKLRSLGLPASQIADDSTFLRRVTIDIAGRLPTVDETVAFLSDASPDKRDRLVDRLLDSADYAEYFANKWAAILRNKRDGEEDKVATFAFHDWIRESFRENKPYDRFVREIIASSGEVGVNPPVAWYREVRDLSAQVEDTAQLFLGLRIQCARCHHHPFEAWSQQDYYGFAAFYSQVGRKRGTTGQDRIFAQRIVAQTQNPKTGAMVLATGLGADGPAPIGADVDARHALADWMSDPENPFFARALVNRYWKHFFGRGLVDPEDDMRVTNPASNPELLDSLAQDFIDSGYDLKHLVRTITRSTTYQLSALPNDWNGNDKQNFSRYYPKRLNAEVLLDAVDQLTGSRSTFGGVPGDFRAVALPDNGFNSYFLTVFGRPESSSACECERTGDANLAQSLHLLNSGEIQGKLTSAEGRAARLAGAADVGAPEKIRQLYLVAFSRQPDPEELAIAVAHLERFPEDPKRAFEDICWALLNTKEFLFNH